MRIFVKIISGNLFHCQLSLRAASPTVINKERPKNLKGKLGGDMSIQALKTLEYFWQARKPCIQTRLCVCTEGCEHVQKISKKGVIAPLVDHDTLPKQKVKAKADLKNNLP